MLDNKHEDPSPSFSFPIIRACTFSESYIEQADGRSRHHEVSFPRLRQAGLVGLGVEERKQAQTIK